MEVHASGDESSSALSEHTPVEVSVGDTSDPDPIMVGGEDTPFVRSQQNFHQACMANCYQFDTLRRAKHSTMMMLHHLFAISDPRTVQGYAYAS